jgi:hypothetical protein
MKTPYGKAHKQAKLTSRKVKRMRSDYFENKFKLAPLAVKYGVSLTTAFRAINGITWKHVG